LPQSLLTDRDWAKIDGEWCLVIEFIPIAGMAEGQVKPIEGAPYASVRFQTQTQGELTGFIGHKIDFAMLWAAFHKRAQVENTRLQLHPSVKDLSGLSGSLGDDEQVWFIWTKKSYVGPLRFLSLALPKLKVTVSRKGSSDLLAQWIPAVMK
jgi:hypothetical protein